ncbi:MAG: dynamin family protein [Hyphomicrobiaceae bacterium]|nr:dynamin family protein [Hyphomicrobiaceae bacterium]
MPLNANPIEDWARTRELQRETATTLAAAAATLAATRSRNSGHLSARLNAIAARLRAPLRVVVAGEFNTGKTTLCNRLIGVDALPTSALPMTNLWTRIYAAPSIEAFVRTTSGKREPIGAVTAAVADWSSLDIGAPSDRLAGIELIDLPGLADPRFDRTIALVRNAHPNVLLWCTSSTQACKESERSEWSQLAPALLARSFLVLTFSDLVKSPSDRTKLMRRAEDMAAGVFAGVVKVSSKTAPASDSDDTTPSDIAHAWGEVCRQLSRLGKRRCQLAVSLAHRILSRRA